MWVIIFQRIALEFLFDVLFFPLWWYTGGVKFSGTACIHLFQDANLTLAPGLWLKNIFVPMFGQTDWQGRLTSVFMRIVNVIIRSIALVFVALVVLLLFCTWLIFPLFILYMLIISLFGG